jgi:hypothetical protein
MEFIPNASYRPAAPSISKVASERFLGLDASMSEDEISLGRADGISYFESETDPEMAGTPTVGALNMIRTSIGEVGKRRGRRKSRVLEYESADEQAVAVKKGEHETFVFTYSEADSMLRVYIYGRAGYDKTYELGDYTLNNIVIIDEVLYGFLSESAVLKLWFDLGGSTMPGYRALIYDKDKVQNLNYGTSSSEISDFSELYIPTITAGSLPTGGGVGLEPVNLLNPYVRESYTGDGSSTEYAVSLVPNGIGSTGAKLYAEVMDENGVWQSAALESPSVIIPGQVKTVTFETAPPAPPVEGEDNVRIYYRRADDEVSAGMGAICSCRCYTQYGLAGYKDRLFMSGCAEYPGYVWYSAMDKPLYFGDLFYIRVGTGSEQVYGLAGQDTRLAVICKDEVYLISGSLSSSDSGGDYYQPAQFLISSRFKSPRPSGYQQPVGFDNDVMYLTESGVCAVTTSGIMDERYAQIRSAFINYWLKKEQLSECVMEACGDFLVIKGGGGRLYLLDGKQFSKAQAEPFSYRQFEGYIWQIGEADFIWSSGGSLYFLAKAGGVIYSIDFGPAEQGDFSDEVVSATGESSFVPIKAYWETPYVYGSRFYSKKSFSTVALLLKKTLGDDGFEINTGVKVYFKKDNQPFKVLCDYDGKFSVFRYDNVDYGHFTYANRIKSYVLSRRIRIKKAQRVKFRFVNDILNQPFFLQEFAVEY